MGSIANFDYPDHTIEEAVDIIEIVHDEGITDQELLADRLGHANAESGAFRNKLTSLRRYGLISDRGEISLSSLAERIVIPEPGTDERERAIGEAVENVDLLDRLYDRLDYEEPDDNFFYQVAQLTGAERPEAKEKSSRIERLYREGLRYVKLLHEEEAERGHEISGAQTSESRQSVPTQPEEADATLMTPDGSVIHIKSKATFLAAQTILDDIGAKYDIDDNAGNNDFESNEESEVGVEYRTMNNFKD